MRFPVDVQQPLRIDLRVDLRRRQAGVAQELLDRPEVAPASQEVRGERMAKRMWCGAWLEPGKNASAITRPIEFPFGRIPDFYHRLKIGLCRHSRENEV